MTARCDRCGWTGPQDQAAAHDTRRHGPLALCDAAGCEHTAMFMVRPTDDAPPHARVLLLCDDHAAPWMDLPSLRGVG